MITFSSGWMVLLVTSSNSNTSSSSLAIGDNVPHRKSSV